MTAFLVFTEGEPLIVAAPEEEVTDGRLVESLSRTAPIHETATGTGSCDSRQINRANHRPAIRTPWDIPCPSIPPGCPSQNPHWCTHAG